MRSMWARVGLLSLAAFSCKANPPPQAASAGMGAAAGGSSGGSAARPTTAGTSGAGGTTSRGMTTTTAGGRAGDGGSAGTSQNQVGGADAGVQRDSGAADSGAPTPPNQDGCIASEGSSPMLEAGTWVKLSPPDSVSCMDVHVLPCNPSVLYVTTFAGGMWRSRNGGATWARVGDLPSPVSAGVLAIDPRRSLSMYYGGGVQGSSLGFWRSSDGGETWTQPKSFTAGASNASDGWVNDVYSVTADPNDFRHVLVTFHSGWGGKEDAGVLESKDGGDTWIRHAPRAGWGAGHGISFLRDAQTWLLGTQWNGYWRTTDAGQNWTQVSTHLSIHGATTALYSSTGVLYVGANNQIMRSTDDGATFTLVGPQTQDGYYTVISDGKYLYTQSANTGLNTTGPQPYLVSKDDDGQTWTPYNEQTFRNGPYRMALDTTHRILYSANWDTGVWAVKLKP